MNRDRTFITTASWARSGGQPEVHHAGNQLGGRLSATTAQAFQHFSQRCARLLDSPAGCDDVIPPPSERLDALAWFIIAHPRAQVAVQSAVAVATLIPEHGDFVDGTS